MFLGVQGLRNYQKRRVPPRSSVTTTQSHPKQGHLLPSTEILAGKLPMAGCFCHHVFPAVRLFPWPFLKGNTHLQLLGYRNCKISYTACAKYPTAARAVGDRGWGLWAGTPGWVMLFGNTLWGDAFRATGRWGQLHISTRSYCKGTPVAMRKSQYKKKSLHKDWGFPCEHRKYQSLWMTHYSWLPCPAFTGLTALSCGSNQEFYE